MDEPDAAFVSRQPSKASSVLVCALLALASVCAFWAFASACDWFVDAPFRYTTEDEWSQNLVRSAARGLHREEAALFIASLFTVLPAVWFLALALRGRPPRPLLALRRFAARGSLRFGAVLAALATALSWLFFRFVLSGTALLDDEYSYLFAARNMASGTFFRSSAPAAFRNPMILTAPAWISKYPPGFPALLVPGVLLGLPRLLPCFVCALSVLGMFYLARTLFGLRTAVVASIFWASSPFQLAVDGTTMIFGASCCLALWTCALVARGLFQRDERAIAGAALVTAIHVLVRPFDAGFVLATVAVPIFAFGSAGVALRRVAVLGGGALLGTLGLGAFNQRALGSAASFGYTSAGDYRFGFFVHSLPGFEYVHTPLQALAHVLVAIARLDGWLIGVPGCLLLVLLVLPRPSRREQALLLGIVVHLLGYSLAASSGTFDVGPTYYFLAAPCYLLLALRGALRLQLALSPKFRSIVTWVGVVALPVAWLTVVPVKVLRLASLSEAIRAPWSFLAATDLTEGLVVVPPFATLHAAGYALGYPYEVRTRAGVVKLIRPESRAELAEAARFLHYTGPVYQLQVDERLFQKDGTRRYTLAKLSP